MIAMPSALQLLQHPEDLGHVRRGQRRGCFIENENFGIAGECLGDFHHLAPRQRKIADWRQGVDVLAAYPGQRLLGQPSLRAVVNQPEALGRMGDGDVIGDAEVGEKRQLLENTGDARLVCRRRAGE